MSGKQRRQVRRYYKRTLYGGRNAFARAVDFVMLRAVALLSCYLYFASVLQNTLLAWLMAFVAVGMGCVAAELYKSIRLERSIGAQREELKRKSLQEKLLAMPHMEYRSLIQDYVSAHPDEFGEDTFIVTLQQKAKVNEDTVLAVCRSAQRRGSKRAVIFATSGQGDYSLAQLKRFSGVEVEFFPVLTLAGKDDRTTLSDDDADMLVLDMLNEEKEKRKRIVKEPFKTTRIRRYLLVAAGLFAMSFFVQYALYYRLLAIACVTFSTIAWFAGGMAKREQAR